MELKILGEAASWLSTDISDHQVCIQGFKINKLEREIRGGGVAIYLLIKMYRNLLFKQIGDVVTGSGYFFYVGI